MTPRPLLLALAPLLAACAYEPLEIAPDVLARGAEPWYQLRPGGGIAATSCLAGRPSGYGQAPPACVVDNAFAVQAANPSDLVAPRQPGDPLAAPVAAAAYDYIFGDGVGGDTVLTLDGPGAPGGAAGRLDIPPAGAGTGGALSP